MIISDISKDIKPIHTATQAAWPHKIKLSLKRSFIVNALLETRRFESFSNYEGQRPSVSQEY
jgi:hypothetical protein